MQRTSGVVSCSTLRYVIQVLQERFTAPYATAHSQLQPPPGKFKAQKTMGKAQRRAQTELKQKTHV